MRRRAGPSRSPVPGRAAAALARSRGVASAGPPCAARRRPHWIFVLRHLQVEPWRHGCPVALQ